MQYQPERFQCAFSPTASFVAAALTGAIGVASIANAKHLDELPLPAMPLLFAAPTGCGGTSLCPTCWRPRTEFLAAHSAFPAFAKVILAGLRGQSQPF